MLPSATLGSMTDDLTPGQRRMAKAHEARRRTSQELRAQYLRDRGWLCVPPERAAAVNDAIEAWLGAKR